MALLVCSVLVPGRLEDVFRFHTNPDNIMRVQPPGMRPSVVEFPQPVEEGSQCRIVIPTLLGSQEWTIRIEKFRCLHDKGRALMVDRAVKSPFPFWLHRHCFEAEGGKTRMTDVVDFKLPFGMLGVLMVPSVWMGLWCLFFLRHVRTVNFFRKHGEAA